MTRTPIPTTTRPMGAGMLVALLSAATFATSGPFAKSLLTTGWTPGSVVFLRIGGAALILAVPTARALKGRWGDLLRAWPQLVTYGLMAVAVPQLAFFYAVEHLSVGVALLLEYLGMVLVVVWQSLVARRAPRSTTLVGMGLAIVGLLLVLDVLGGVRIDGIGVLFGLVAAFGLASFFLLSEGSHEDSLPPLALAGVGLMAAAVAFAVLGATGVLPMSFPSSRGRPCRHLVPVVGGRPRARPDRGGHVVRLGDRGDAPARRQAGLVRRTQRGHVRRAVRLAAAR